MSLDKITTITDWLEPHKVKDIQSFLGFTNFYRRFIFNYSDITVPLTQLTQKDAPWNFSEECHRSFNALKHAFTTTPILTHFIPDTPITMETDASDYAVAGILSITCADGELHPVAFYSRTLTAPELNYDTHNKELLAIFEAFRTWHHYLEGSTTPVDVVMDHKNLEYFSTSKVLTHWQAWWSELLSSFNLVICFHPGKLGAKPDAFTGRWCQDHVQLWTLIWSKDQLDRKYSCSTDPTRTLCTIPGPGLASHTYHPLSPYLTLDIFPY